jgi:nitric oxide reductase subunit C
VRYLFLVLGVILILGLASCGEAAAPVGQGSAAEGEKIFSQGAAPACSACHSLDPGKTLVGPSLATIGTIAVEKGGIKPDEWLKSAIIDPNAEVAAGFGANLMPATYGAQLTSQQIADLVAYMLTLR